jgi:hypothetical protein
VGDTGSSGPDRGREAEESRCPAVSGNGGSSTLIVEWRERYMLISEPTPSAVGEVVGEHSVTSRNGTIDIVGDSKIGGRSREIRERLPRGGGDRLVEFKLCWGGKSIVK